MMDSVAAIYLPRGHFQPVDGSSQNTGHNWNRT